MNRTNISGVITGGVIGGRDQTGTYKIGARFTRRTLINKIQDIAAMADRIQLYNMDVLEMMEGVFPSLTDSVLVNFDPPYVNKGSKLYKNAFSEEDHKRLRDKIAICEKKWIVTYDVCDLIKNLYSNFRGGYIDVYYSANEIRKAKEYIFYSNELVIPVKNRFFKEG